jgi:hypothetical protein
MRRDNLHPLFWATVLLLVSGAVTPVVGTAESTSLWPSYVGRSMVGLVSLGSNYLAARSATTISSMAMRIR